MVARLSRGFLSIRRSFSNYTNLNKTHLIGQDYYKNKFSELIHCEYFNNSSFYSSYTPYQAEIAQGRLELGYVYQTIIRNLTGLEFSNCGLLDHSHSLFESIRMIINYNKKNYPVEKDNNKVIICDKNMFDHLKLVLTTYENKIFNEQGIYLVYVDLGTDNLFYEINKELQNQKINVKIPNNVNYENICGFINFSSDKYGLINKNYDEIDILKEHVDSLKKNKVLHVISGDLLHHVSLKSHKDLGADIAVGNIQRLGLPLYNGGPHSGYIAVSEELIRFLPGRIIGMSKNKYSDNVYRLALQTREQHIKKFNATSNICTNQSLMNNYMALYVLEHGEQGLKEKINKIMQLRNFLIDHSSSLFNRQLDNKSKNLFLDTITFKGKQSDIFYQHNDRTNNDKLMSGTYTDTDDMEFIYRIMKNENLEIDEKYLEMENNQDIYRDADEIIFDKGINKFNNDPLELMRYIKEIMNKDFSLIDGMMPLGSCTMKINHPKYVTKINNSYLINKHPFSEDEQITNILKNKLENQEQIIYELTGFTNSSFQTMSGSHSELVSLLMMKEYAKMMYPSKKKNVILVAESAHGTNFASVNMANLKCEIIKHTANGYFDLNDIDKKIKEYGDQILGIMITFPSTYGFYDETLPQVIKKVKSVEGIIYLDGANMNAWVGSIRPYELGFDIMHINLHKTFNIPHGGGGPGGGCIATTHLFNYLPAISKNMRVSSSVYGNTCANFISESYMNENRKSFKNISNLATKNANYIKEKLMDDYVIKFVDKEGMVAHEVILDLSMLLKVSDLNINDICKRIIDYGIHPPTVSFPVPNCFMIEPTESENKENLDYFINAMKEIKKEILEVINGKYDSKNNVLTNSPHSIEDLLNWNYPYSIEKGFRPLGKNTKKFYFTINRVDEVYGDRNIIKKINS
jgi:glycine dehydrogenase